MSTAEHAQRIDVPLNGITEIFNDRRGAKGETAFRLGRFVGTSHGFWLNFEKP